MGPRLPDRPRVPRFPDLLRLQPRRLQPPEDAGPRVPADARARRAAEAVELGRLQRRVRVVRGHLRAPGHAAGDEVRVLRRGRRARRRERAQGRVRLEGPAQQGQGHPRREGRRGDALPRGLPRPQRLHPLPHQHGPAQDRLLPQVPLAAHREPQAPLPRHPGGGGRRARGRGARPRPDAQGVRRPRRRRGLHHHRAHPGRGRRQPLPPRVPAGPAAHGPRARVPVRGR